jgi:MFS transporter, ACS family, D-galactonate transporter
MHMDILRSASFVAIPRMFTTMSDWVAGGWLINHVLARGCGETRARQAVLVAACWSAWRCSAQR